MCETFRLENDTDGQALAAARSLLLPEEDGEVWQAARLVARLRGRSS